MRRAARNLAISSRKSLCELKEKRSRPRLEHGRGRPPGRRAVGRHGLHQGRSNRADQAQRHRRRRRTRRRPTPKCCTPSSSWSPSAGRSGSSSPIAASRRSSTTTTPKTIDVMKRVGHLDAVNQAISDVKAPVVAVGLEDAADELELLGSKDTPDVAQDQARKGRATGPTASSWPSCCSPSIT